MSGRITLRLTPYAFQEKVARALGLVAVDKYDEVSQAIDLLQEAIEEQPAYLPAYEALYHAHWIRMGYVDNEFENDIREIRRLTTKMEEISPNAPETLIVKAVSSGIGDGGAAKSSLGVDLDKSWEELIEEALEKDPNNTIARAYRSNRIMDEGQYTPVEKLRAHQDALRFSPTDPAVLAGFSRSERCQGNLEEATILANNNISWNPDNRRALDSIASIARARAEYLAALRALDGIIAHGRIQHNQTKILRTLYFDLGVPEKALPYVIYPPVKADVYAMMGAAPDTLREAQIVPQFYTSQRAVLTAMPDKVPSEYNVYPHYIEVKDHIEGHLANPCSLNYLAIDVYGLRFTDPKRSDVFLELLANYFVERDATSLQTSEEYIGLMSLHVLQGNYDMALEVMDIAMNKGYVFVGRFREPVLRQLASHPEFKPRFDNMQAKATDILEMYKAGAGL